MENNDMIVTNRYTLGDFEFFLFFEDRKIRLSAINKITFDKYERVINEVDVSRLTNFLSDIVILYKLIEEQFKIFPAHDDIVMTIEDKENNLILYFESNKMVKYCKIKFDVIMQKNRLSGDEYIVQRLEQTGLLIKKSDDELVKLRSENDVLKHHVDILNGANAELNTKFETFSRDMMNELRLLNSKVGNYIIIGNGFTIRSDVTEISSEHGVNLHSSEDEMRFTFNDTQGVINYKRYGYLTCLSEKALMPLNLLRQLTSITIHNNINIRSLDFIKECRSLVSVTFYGCTELVDISALNNKPLKSVSFEGCTKLVNVLPIKDCPLENLNIKRTAVNNCIAFQENVNLKIIK